MKDYRPVMSFGAAVAETYRDIQRGDESAAVSEPFSSDSSAHVSVYGR